MAFLNVNVIVHIYNNAYIVLERFRNSFFLNLSYTFSKIERAGVPVLR